MTVKIILTMNHAALAEELIAADSAAARAKLLAQNAGLADESLARAFKTICYAAWTSEPTVAQRADRAAQSLVKFNRSAEIAALAYWIRGIARITEGKLDSAVVSLNKSAALFDRINQPSEAAQTQVAKLYPLAVLGRYAEATECGSRALDYFIRVGDDLAAGKVEKNLGNIAARQGDEKLAEKYYLTARRRFTKIKNVEELTMSENSLANTYAELNDFRRAETFYEHALKRARAEKMAVTEAEIEASIGNLALYRGRYDRALKFLELSRRKYAALDMPHQTAVAELEIADVYLELNLTPEAFSIYEKVAGDLRALKMQGEEARARANFGRAAAAQNDLSTARRELKIAARLYLLEKNKTGAAAVKLSEAQLEFDAGNYRKTLKLAQQAEDLLAESGNKRHQLTARLFAAEALRKLSVTNEARDLLKQIYADSIRSEQPQTAQSAQTALGKIAFAAGDLRQAEKHFTRAVRIIETQRAPLAAEEFRMAFFADKLAPFENLAKIYLAENKWRQALTIIEKARARSLAESLGNAAANDQAGENTDEKAQHLENLREKLNWFYSRLNRAGESEYQNLQTEAQRCEKQIADVMRQTASTSDARRGTENFFDFKHLQNHLGGQKALIEFVNFDGVLSAFVVTNRKISYAAELGREDEIVALLESLRFQFDALRYGAESLRRHLAELKQRADFHLGKLYEKLIAPLEQFYGQRDLIVVPVGALHYVPFHALFDGEKYLIERRTAVYAPSATVWNHLASKPSRQLKNALLMGYADERIPLVNAEIAALSEIFPKSKKLTSEQATFAAFTKNAAHCDVLHLACHGSFRPENPLFSSLHLADGHITVRDLAAQKLRAEIVVLSACETGLNKIFAGDEILGLARGFLSAGASSLILSLWTVNDEATTDLMKSFYRELQIGQTAAAALRTAQRELIERGRHPYFWSPFALIGK